MSDFDKTPVPGEPTMAELHALVRRLLERVKALETSRIIETINEHEERLDTHDERFDDAEKTLLELRRANDAASMWRTAIGLKTDDTNAVVHRLAAVLLPKE